MKAVLLDELQNLLSAEGEIRKSAEEHIRHLEFTEDYGINLSEVVMDQNLPLPLRQIACSILTRYVANYWNEDTYADDAKTTKCKIVSDEAKHSIRQVLPNGLYDSNSKIRGAVAYAISTIAASDWPNLWTDLFEITMKCLGGNEYSIQGAMGVLQDFNYDEKHIQTLGPMVISEVHRIFESECYSLEIRTSAIRILKPLFISINIVISNREQKTNMINSILSNFMDKLIYYLSANTSNASNFLLRSEILKLFCFLFNEMPKYIQPYMKQLLPVTWQLLTHIADTYVKVVVNETEENTFPVERDSTPDDELVNFINLILQIIDFLYTIIESSRLCNTVLEVLPDLIYVMIIYLQLSQEQLDGWDGDWEKFVEDMDEGIEMNVRNSCQQLLEGLLDKFGSKVLPATQEALRRHITQAEREKVVGNRFYWKILEACMLVVHLYRHMLRNPTELFDVLNYLSLVRTWLGGTDQTYLVGRALWTLSTYCHLSSYTNEMLQEILNLTAESLQPLKPTPLKISAIRSIQSIVQPYDTCNEEKRQLIKAKLPAFMEGILAIIPQCKCTEHGVMLESLTGIIRFDPVFAATCREKLIPLTMDMFFKYSSDPFLETIVRRLIRYLCQNESCLQAIHEKFIPTIVNVISFEGGKSILTKQDLAIDVLTIIVKYSKAPLPEILIETAFPAMMHCVLHSEDHEILTSGGECLKTFIFVAPEQICAYKNGQGLTYIMELTTSMLNPMNSDRSAVQIGSLIITIIRKAGNILGDNVDLLLKAVISKMQLVECLRVLSNLIMVFAYLILTQLEAVLNFLSTVPGPTGEPALTFVITVWLSKQTSFFGVFERKLTIFSLCRLFEYAIATQDTRITSIPIVDTDFMANAISDSKRVMTRSQTSALNRNAVTIPILVKILKLLIYELRHSKECRLSDYETESETDESFSGDDHIKSEEESSESKMPHLSNWNVNDDDEDEDDDDIPGDVLMEELLKDSMFHSNMEAALAKFLHDFCKSEHYQMFNDHLTASEKQTLASYII